MTNLSWLSRSRAQLRTSAVKLRNDERGQTPTEYLMIVGLMAVVIVIAFSIYFWPNIKDAAKQWSNNAKTSISGEKIKQ